MFNQRKKFEEETLELFKKTMKLVDKEREIRELYQALKMPKKAMGDIMFLLRGQSYEQHEAYLKMLGKRRERSERMKSIKKKRRDAVCSTAPARAPEGHA